MQATDTVPMSAKYLKLLVSRATCAAVESYAGDGAEYIHQVRMGLTACRPPGVVLVSCASVTHTSGGVRLPGTATKVVVAVADPSLFILNIIGDPDSLRAMFPQVSRNGLLQMVRSELAQQPEAARKRMWAALIADALRVPSIKAQLPGGMHIVMPSSALLIEGWADCLAFLGAKGAHPGEAV